MTERYKDKEMKRQRDTKMEGKINRKRRNTKTEIERQRVFMSERYKDKEMKRQRDTKTQRWRER